MVLLARGNESVLLDLGLVERLYSNSGGLHSADLIFYGLQYWRPTDSVTYKSVKIEIKYRLALLPLKPKPAYRCQEALHFRFDLFIDF